MDFFNAMDPDTAALIIQLLIEEASDMFDASAGKGKGREGELSDTQVALLLHKEELIGENGVPHCRPPNDE